jgi:hypothetical protein
LVEFEGYPKLKGATPMIRYYLRYARYALAALATVGFDRVTN